jgi:hypothetical protein
MIYFENIVPHCTISSARNLLVLVVVAKSFFQFLLFLQSVFQIFVSGLKFDVFHQCLRSRFREKTGRLCVFVGRDKQENSICTRIIRMLCNADFNGFFLLAKSQSCKF